VIISSDLSDKRNSDDEQDGMIRDMIRVASKGDGLRPRIAEVCCFRDCWTMILTLSERMEYADRCPSIEMPGILTFSHNILPVVDLSLSPNCNPDQRRFKTRPDQQLIGISQVGHHTSPSN
jgi:hypothetical protein